MQSDAMCDGQPCDGSVRRPSRCNDDDHRVDDSGTHEDAQQGRTLKRVASFRGGRSPNTSAGSTRDSQIYQSGNVLKQQKRSTSIDIVMSSVDIATDQRREEFSVRGGHQSVSVINAPLAFSAPKVEDIDVRAGYNKEMVLVPANQDDPSSPIDALKDDDIRKVFGMLAYFERLSFSEVCRRWYRVARQEWRLVEHLDLGSIPSEFINGVLKQCTDLKSVFAARKEFGSGELRCVGEHGGISSIKLYDCKCVAGFHQVLGVFSAKFAHSPCAELVVHDVYFTASSWTSLGPDYLFSSYLPTSVTRLQLSSIFADWCFDDISTAKVFVDGFERLENLECLILLRQPEDKHYKDGDMDLLERIDYPPVQYQLIDKICGLKKLKEVCIGLVAMLAGNVASLVWRLENLQVLFLYDTLIDSNPEPVAHAIETHASLRILVFTGILGARNPFEPIDRQPYPYGLGVDPLPMLNIFVPEDDTTAQIRVAESTTNVAVVHHVSQTLPELLNMDEFAPIFRGVWIADQLRETAKHGGGSLWD